MIHDVVTEMRRRRSFYETTGFVQAPYYMDGQSVPFCTEPSHIEGYAGAVMGHAGWCDHCGISIDGKGFWRKQYNQCICGKCANDLGIDMVPVPAPAVRERF